jgi:hypothetical protein
VLKLYEFELRSRLLIGTSQYPSPAVMIEAIKASRADVVTVSLRHESSEERVGQGFWSVVRGLGLRVLPNTAGCHSAKEAIATAQMAREVFGTTWVKLEVVGENDTLQPDVFGLVEAARILCAQEFDVFPYTTEDLVVADKLRRRCCRLSCRPKSQPRISLSICGASRKRRTHRSLRFCASRLIRWKASKLIIHVSPVSFYVAAPVRGPGEPRVPCKDRATATWR